VFFPDLAQLSVSPLYCVLHLWAFRRPLPYLFSEPVYHPCRRFPTPATNPYVPEMLLELCCGFYGFSELQCQLICLCSTRCSLCMTSPVRFKNRRSTTRRPPFSSNSRLSSPCCSEPSHPPIRCVDCSSFFSSSLTPVKVDQSPWVPPLRVPDVPSLDER